MSLFRDLTINKNSTSPITIVGTLTNNNGVYSGFSPSNYLLLNPNNQFTDYTENASSWEVVFKFTYAASSASYNYNGRQLIYSQGASYGCSFGVANGKLIIGLSNTDGANSIGARGGSTTLVAGNTYWYKAEFTGSAYKMYLSTNGADYTQEGSTITSSTRLTPRGVWAIGRNVNGASDLYSYAWQGSIDINNSYIKMNDKYWWKG